MSRTPAQALAIISQAFPKARDVFVREGEFVAMSPSMTMHVDAEVAVDRAFLIAPSIVKALSRVGEFALSIDGGRVKADSSLGNLSFRPLAVPAFMPREDHEFARLIELSSPGELSRLASLVDGTDLINVANRGVTVMPVDDAWMAVATNGKAFAARQIGAKSAQGSGITVPPDTARAIASIGASSIELSPISLRASCNGVRILSSLLVSGQFGNDIQTETSYERYRGFITKAQAMPTIAALDQTAVERMQEALVVGKAAGIDLLRLESDTGSLLLIGKAARGDSKDASLRVRVEASAQPFSASFGLDAFAELVAMVIGREGLDLAVSPLCAVFRASDSPGVIAALSQIREGD